MKVTVAQALHDRPIFLQMWKQFLAETFSLTGLNPPSDHNMSEFTKLYNAYTLGSLHGSCLLGWVNDEPSGVVLWGEDFPGGLHLETTSGRTTILWGVYVTPQHRGSLLAHRLLRKAIQEAHRMGFNAAVTYIHPDNEDSLRVLNGLIREPTMTGMAYHIPLGSA